MTDPVIGRGRYRYSFRRDWARLPRWWHFGDPTPGPRPPQTAVQGAVAANGDVYVLARSPHPVTIFDADGAFVSSWGEGCFSSFVHGIQIAPDGNVWITDSGTHTVSEHTPDGRRLRTLGSPEFPAPTLYGGPFNMPTGVAFAGDGTFYVSDGYGNRRVHHFAAEGTLLQSWGGPGTGPGEFAIVHFIEIDAKGRIHITDRENNRIQIFEPDGAFLAEWTGFVMPSDLAFGKRTTAVAAQDGLHIFSHAQEPLAHFPRDVTGPDSLNIHGVWLDAEENIYLAQFDRTVSKLTRLVG